MQYVAVSAVPVKSRWDNVMMCVGVSYAISTVSPVNGVCGGRETRGHATVRMIAAQQKKIVICGAYVSCIGCTM